MGSMCQKGAETKEELVLPQGAAGPAQPEQKADEPVSKSPQKSVDEQQENSFKELIHGLVLPDGPIKVGRRVELQEKLKQLPPFDFVVSKQAASLTITKDGITTESETFFGFWDPVLNMREYKGVILYKDGGYFEGHFLHGKIEGKGRKIYFIKQEQEGQAAMATVCCYEGDWKDGLQSGQGKEVKEGEYEYTGSFEKGQKHGKGRCEFIDKTVYEGDFFNDAPEGIGKCNLSNGVVYTGQWKGGLCHGEGTMKMTDGTTYTGSFETGKKQGKGTLSWQHAE